MEQDYKQCTNKKCLQWFPATEEYFYKQKKQNKKDGIFYVLTSWCKVCHKSKSKKYRDEHAEESRERKREWYRNGTNKIKVKLYNKEYNEKDPSVKRDILKKWQSENPERIRDYRYKRMHKDHDITEDEWAACKQYFDNSCAYCELHISEHYNTYAGELKHTDFHREHVDDDGVDDLSNCIPACKSCNSQKHTFEFKSWYNEENPIFNQERYERIIQWLNVDYKKFQLKV